MAEDDADGFEEDFQFKAEGAFFYVFDIEEDLFLGAEVVAAADLGESGYAGFYFKALAEAVDVFFKGFVKLGALGARTDYGKLTREASPELRKLVHAGFSEKFSDLGYTVIVITVRPFCTVLFGIGNH